jgi:hypothetical protein
VVEQLAQTDEGRQTMDQILSPGFIHSLKAVTSAKRSLFFEPAIIVFENANAPGRWAWISPVEDEVVWPVAILQQLQLDQTISAVWEDNFRPVVELFLFDGTDLQDRLTRIARVQSPVPQLELVLDAPSLDNQSRSLLGSVRSTPGRRYSSEQELGGAVTLAFSEWLSTSGVSQFGTASLTEPPHFSWDGYAIWLASGGTFPPLPKTAALRIHLTIRIDDVLYGITTASLVTDTVLKRTGGTTPIVFVTQQSFTNVPPPWVGNVSAGDIRWGFYIGQVLGLDLSNTVVQQVSLLAGSSPGSVRILPGRSTHVPNPPSTHWGLIEIGRTDDDSTIVLSP